MSASSSGASGGIPKTLVSVIGMLVSGWIMQKWKPRARLLAGWCVIADALAILGVCCISLFSCPQSYFPSVSQDGSRYLLNFNQLCDKFKFQNTVSNVLIHLIMFYTKLATFRTC